MVRFTGAIHGFPGTAHSIGSDNGRYVRLEVGDAARPAGFGLRPPTLYFNWSRARRDGALAGGVSPRFSVQAPKAFNVESISVFDMFKVGVGPSSSHTMGPWRAAQAFLSACRARNEFERIEEVRVDLFGSLAKTGVGHGTDLAVVLGLAGEDPSTCATETIHARFAAVAAARRLRLDDDRAIAFDPAVDVVFHRDVTLPFHPNGLTFTATLDDASTHSETYYSIGGGFITRENEPRDETPTVATPYPVEHGGDLLAHCRATGLSIPALVLRNELARRDLDAIRDGLRRIWHTMTACVYRGAHTAGVLPGSLGVVRRASSLNATLLGGRVCPTIDAWLDAVRAAPHGFSETLKWVSCFALAVNEENAAFGRVVTAPTNGAAGVVPAVLLYADRFRDATENDVFDFLLTASMIGGLFKKGATISAALGGCQAEIGVSSAMAAAGLAQTRGANPEQVLMAAEIAMEHHLGLTCDPVAGLVQIPCIERNTMGAIKALTACEIALASDPANAKVSLDAVIRSMWQTALDMNFKYKETSEGGLALQIPVNLAEC